MKKIILPIIMIIPFALCGCDNTNKVNNSSKNESSNIIGVETDKTKRYDIDLTVNNYWKYLDITGDFEASYYSYKSLSYSVSGVLSYAYYEDVMITFDYCGGYYNSYTNTKNDKEYHANIYANLNAAGNDSGSIAYNYVPTNITPEFKDDSFYSYDRKLSIKSITGTIHFAI